MRTQSMSTIQIQRWQPEPTENLAEDIPVEKGPSPPKIKIDLPANVSITGADLIGMTWMLLEDD